MAERLLKLEAFLIDRLSTNYISGHNEIYAGALKQLLHAYAENSLSTRDVVKEWVKKNVTSIETEYDVEVNYAVTELRYKRNVLAALSAINAYLR